MVLAALAGLSSVSTSGSSHAVEPQPVAAKPDEQAPVDRAGAEKVMAQKPGERTKGYTCVFMGHSFFYRVAHDLEHVVRGSGFPEHKQVVRAAHGIEGTPGWLWDHVGPKEEVRRMLKEEKVDILAISYHGRSADKCKLEDYSRWIDFAREKNPDIMFAIGLSWPRLEDRTPEQ